MTIYNILAHRVLKCHEAVADDDNRQMIACRLVFRVAQSQSITFAGKLGFPDSGGIGVVFSEHF